MSTPRPPAALFAHPALPAVEDAIRARTGNAFRITHAEPAPGGCIHTAMTVSDTTGARYFVKLGPRHCAPMFAAEADGLAAIAASDSFRTSAVIALSAEDAQDPQYAEDERNEHAFLVLEHLALRPVQSAADGARFAEALVAMHRHTGDIFGWSRDNFIGRTPQHNAAHANWALFFAERRLRPQLALAREKGFGGELQKQGERLLPRLPALFLDYRPRESLVHGDLWHGNAAMLADGTPVVFDPAIHHGDRESDLAMSELFGGFPSNFYASYRKAWPLHEDYAQRKLLYSLYHVLNHLNLFGRGYLGEAMRLVVKLNQELALGRA